jgi:hypothetical protein
VSPTSSEGLSSLTPEQKKVVDGLKLELQRLAGSQAADEGKQALGGLLERKP